jgi:hypothetical protein
MARMMLSLRDSRKHDASAHRATDVLEPVHSSRLTEIAEATA